MVAFFLSFRECIEAALIVSILLGTLRRLGQPAMIRYVWIGVSSAALLSILVATIISGIGLQFEGQAEQIFEGITLLLAATFLTTMIFWMRRQGSALRARLAGEVSRLAEVDGTGRGALGLFTVAFLAVMREGIELALFLAATALSSSPGATIPGALLGFGAAVVVGILIFQSVVHLDLKQLFAVTNLLLLLFAAGMAALGVHELIEAGLLPAIIDPVWDINSVLSEKSAAGELLKGLFGYNGNPALTEVLVYVGYIASVGWLLLSQPVFGSRRQVT